jgi:hypothetical protein
MVNATHAKLAPTRLEIGTKDLLADGGNLKVPCSRYGHDTESCAPVAVAVAVIVAGETGEGSWRDGLEYSMGLVVNDHDDPEYLIRNYGAEYGFDPDSLLQD